MRSRIFLSCGQREDERDTAREVRRLLEDRGFAVYIAIDVQTILEINTGIIGELKNSDYYLFINFRRDRVGEKYRGSLFSNQELAIAYALGFEKILIVNQQDVLTEGILAYIGNNTESFVEFHDCIAAVERALDRSNWSPDYSRRLRADGLRFSDWISFGRLVGRFLYLDIQNHRPDIAALETIARLTEFAASGGDYQPSPIRSPLKATGRPGFSHTIFPNSHEAFDILCVGYPHTSSLLGTHQVSGAFVNPEIEFGHPQVFLNSALDRVPIVPLPITPGLWALRFEFFAIDFPVLSVLVELNFTDTSVPNAKILSQESR